MLLTRTLPVFFMCASRASVTYGPSWAAHTTQLSELPRFEPSPRTYEIFSLFSSSVANGFGAGLVGAALVLFSVRQKILIPSTSRCPSFAFVNIAGEILLVRRALALR